MAVDIPLGVAFSLAKGTAKAGWRVKTMRAEARATGELVCRALELAACDVGLDADVSRDISRAIAAELARTPLSAVDQASPPKRLIPKFLRRKIPNASVLNGVPFSERLERWVIKAMDGPRVRDVLTANPGLHPDPVSLANRFSVDFHGLLVTRLTPFNEVLIRELQSSDHARAWMEDKKRRFKDGFAGAATAGAGTYGATQLADLDDPLLIAAAVTGAAGICALAWAGSLSRPQVSPSQRAARSIVLGWVEDLFRWLKVTPQPSTITEMRLTLARMSRLKCEQSKALTESEILNDLTKRLLPVAAEAEDEQLVIAIRGFEDAVVRGGRGSPDTTAEALTVLLDAIAADESIPEAELQKRGSRRLGRPDRQER